MFIKESKPVPRRTLLTRPPTAGGPKFPPMTALSIGRAQVNQLYRGAAIGKAKAVKDLVELASYATQTVQRLWEENDPTSVKGSARKNRLRRREQFNQAARERDDFPVIQSWRKSRNHSVSTMLAALPLAEDGIWKTKKIEQEVSGAGMHYLILDEIYPRFQWLRRSTVRLSGLEGTIQSLPSLCLATRNKWAQVASKYCASTMYAGIERLRDSKTWMHALANPKRQLAKRVGKARTRLGKRYVGELDFLEAAKKQVRGERIDGRKISDADIFAGLTEAISARLKCILKK